MQQVVLRSVLRQLSNRERLDEIHNNKITLLQNKDVEHDDKHDEHTSSLSTLNSKIDSEILSLENDMDVIETNHTSLQGQVNNLENGVKTWGAPVRLVSVINVPSLTGLLIIDGVQTVEDDEVLISNNNQEAENGIYAVKNAAWVRRTVTSYVGYTVKVNEGTLENTEWICTNDEEPEVGTDDILFVRVCLTPDHNTTGNIQGGTVNEYYHLDETEHTDVVRVSTNLKNVIDLDETENLILSGQFINTTGVGYLSTSTYKRQIVKVVGATNFVVENMLNASGAFGSVRVHVTSMSSAGYKTETWSLAFKENSLAVTLIDTTGTLAGVSSAFDFAGDTLTVTLDNSSENIVKFVMNYNITHCNLNLS